MPAPAIVYAGAWVAGQLGGIALGTAIAKKVLPSQQSRTYTPAGSFFDLHKELDRLTRPFDI